MHPKLRVTPVNNVGMRSGADVVGGVPIQLVFGGGTNSSCKREGAAA